jgi:ribosomal protein S8
MSLINKLENKLSHSDDNILLWLDNTEYLYNRLHKLNDECIDTYYSQGYINEHKQEFRDNIKKYMDLVKLVYDDTKRQEHNYIESDISFRILGHYLYLRELINFKSNLEIRLNTTKSIYKVINE